MHRTDRQTLTSIQWYLLPVTIAVMPLVLGWDSSLKLLAGHSKSELLGMGGCNDNL
jgi:hypothetical protein